MPTSPTKSHNSNKTPIGLDQSELTNIPPQPISIPTSSLDDTEVVSPEPSHPKPLTHSQVFTTLTKLTPFLQKTQKYSSITFSIFSLIHGVGVIVGPLVSISLSNELISLGREIYQSSNMEWWLVWGSLATHVISGIGLRWIRKVLREWNYGDTQPRKKIIDLTSSTDMTQIKDDTTGLIGGVPNYFGLGPKRSFSFKKLGLTPLQFSGYLLIPLVGYHTIQTRLLPLWLEGDSAYVTIEYITYLLNHSRVSSFTNWILYPSLTILTTYHTIFGLARWFDIKDKKLRKLATHSINLISLLGVLAVWKVSKRVNLLGLPEFVLRRFEYYVSWLGL